MRFGPTPTPPPTAAGLCDYVRSDLGLRCVIVLADQALLGPGAVVELPADAPIDSRVPLPVFNLQTNCAVPGSGSALHPSEPRAVALPQFSYEISKYLKEGAHIDLPRISSALDLKVGPKWRSLSRIDISAPLTQVTSIDQISYIENSCSVKQLCVDRILTKKYRVVETAAIVTDFGYKLYDTSGTEVDFQAALKKGLVATANGQEHIERKETLSAKGPLVLAVRFLPDDVIQTKRDAFCKVPTIYAPDGSASVTIAGAIGAQQGSGRLNQSAAVSAGGSESSECDGGHDRTKSNAAASAIVRAPDPQTLELERNISVHGGHYATAASCAFGGTGWTGHDTSASATANLWGQIRITARNDGEQDLKLDYTGVAPNSTLHVSDTTGTALSPAGGGAVGSLAGAGSLTFRVNQAGVYLVRLETLASASTQGGAGVAQDNSTARIKVALEPHAPSPAR